MTLDDVARRIDGARRVMVTCHQRPDGDSTGSMSALAGILGRRGKEVTLYNPDPAPKKLAWLPHIDRLTASLPPDTRFDLTIVVDCGDRKLLGDAFPPQAVTGPLLVLDHHAASRPFGEVYLCDPQASSIGVMVARLARIWGMSLEPEWGVGIYVSMVEDTGSFRYSNTNVEAFELATEVVRAGVDPWAVTEKLLERSVARYKLLAAALGTLELHHGGRIATLKVTKRMVRDARAKWQDAEGIVNYARGIEGVECGVLLRPTPDGGTYVSLRSKGRLIDAGAITMALGGGGHRGAAGCVIALELGDARKVILATLGKALGVEGPDTLEGSFATGPALVAVDRSVAAVDRAGAAAGRSGADMTARSGVLVVDKPEGPSSAQVVARVKRALGADKVGHTGTLDPMATGVLPVVVGEATKLAGMLLAEDKAYDGELELGLETDTLDITGAVVERADAGHVTREALVAAIAGLTGRITQVPPRVSALKQGGRPLYALARAGIEVAPPPREVDVRAFELVSFEPPRARFRVDCSKGTYVRSLVRDLGRAVGTLATLTALRRTRSGAFGLDVAVALEAVGPRSLLVSPAEAIGHLPWVGIDATQAARVRQGQRLRAPAELGADTQVRVLGPDRELVAVATIRDGTLTYDRVILPH